VCVFITAVPITKLFACGKGDSGGHVLSRGLCGLVCPSRTNERGGEEDCVKEGGGGEGERDRERALGLLLCQSALDIQKSEVDPQHSCFGGRDSDFALQRLVECRAFDTERVRLVALR